MDHEEEIEVSPYPPCVCPFCDGQGLLNINDPFPGCFTDCLYCNGEGWIYHVRVI